MQLELLIVKHILLLLENLMFTLKLEKLLVVVLEILRAFLSYHVLKVADPMAYVLQKELYLADMGIELFTFSD